MHEDALAELAQFLARKEPLQLGLAHQDDLEQLLLVGLEVGEEAHLLEDLEGQVLGLVDDEDDVASARDPFQKHAVHLRDEVHLAARELRLP